MVMDVIYPVQKQVNIAKDAIEKRNVLNVMIQDIMEINVLRVVMVVVKMDVIYKVIVENLNAKMELLDLDVTKIVAVQKIQIV